MIVAEHLTVCACADLVLPCYTRPDSVSSAQKWSTQQ